LSDKRPTAFKISKGDFMRQNSKNGHSIDKDLLEISGSYKQYRIDMDRFIKAVKKDVLELKKTPAGRRKLKRAGLLQ
jgi:hypothetical protein